MLPSSKVTAYAKSARKQTWDVFYRTPIDRARCLLKPMKYVEASNIDSIAIILPLLFFAKAYGMLWVTHLSNNNK